MAAPGVDSIERLLGSGEVKILVLRAGCSYRQRLEALLARLDVPTPRMLEFGTLEAIYACAGAGLGITMLPRALLERSSTAVTLSLLTPPATEAIVDTVFVRRSEAFATSALKAFLARVEQGFETSAAA